MAYPSIDDIDVNVIGNQTEFNDNVYVYGDNIKHTFNKIIPKKRGLVLKNKNQIISLIKNNINNNDYLMIKGSNLTGLHNLANNLKKGNLNAL